MLERLNWDTQGRDWPNRAASRFVEAAGLRWHVQIQGQGPLLLLVHGTGAATHSWRDLIPALAERFTLIAPDLPGHGFTSAPEPGRLSLPGMAEALAGLLDALEMRPELAVGHSAGAAILARLCLDGRLAPRALVSLNGALMPWRGLPAHLFGPAARFLSNAPPMWHLFARRARDRAAIERLLQGTGSRLDERGIELYQRVIRTPTHVRSTFTMMANWDLKPIEQALPRLETPLVLVVGEGDLSVPPAEARRIRARQPAAGLISLPGLGHLAHEERPEELAALIARIAAEHGLERA